MDPNHSFASVSQSVSQSASQSAGQPVSQSASQPVSQSASQSVGQSLKKKKMEMSTESKDNVTFHRNPSPSPPIYGSMNDVVSAAATAVDASGILTKMGGGDMFYGAVLLLDVPDSYISLNRPNASPPSHYLFPKVMGKGKDRTGAGEMGLAIQQFYFLKDKPMQAYILSENGRGKIQPLYSGGNNMTFDQVKISQSTNRTTGTLRIQ